MVHLVSAVVLVSEHVALGTELVGVSFPSWHVASTLARPHLGRHQLLSLSGLPSWDRTPLILGARSDFERGV